MGQLHFKYDDGTEHTVEGLSEGIMHNIEGQLQMFFRAVSMGSINIEYKDGGVIKIKPEFIFPGWDPREE